ncbi:hypothetical protein EHI8A_073200 [Entamoeba histolytica HM-1:IMSS-B]|nr:hypothetical protein EHI8A_073200 [Entamoeba histolytica HM-1:IMSS-B]EMS15243.1 hypothetical protein KM1_133550 [Entamoeba histolytica HM-3:IMSS]
MNIFMLPHVLSTWKQPEYKAWEDWKNSLQLYSIYLKNHEFTLTVPTFYMNQTVDENGTTFEELMKEYNLVFIVPNNNITIIEKMVIPWLSKEENTPKKYIGIQFHSVYNFGFGDSDINYMIELKELDVKLKNKYKNYGGIDVLDYEFFKQYYQKHNNKNSLYPSFRTIYFNYFNSYEKNEINKAIQLCQEINSSISLDISEIDSEYFMDCDSFINILSSIKKAGVNYKLLLNRSLWLKEWFVFLNFFHNKCVHQIENI